MGLVPSFQQKVLRFWEIRECQTLRVDTCLVKHWRSVVGAVAGRPCSWREGGSQHGDCSGVELTQGQLCSWVQLLAPLGGEPVSGVVFALSEEVLRAGCFCEASVPARVSLVCLCSYLGFSLLLQGALLFFSTSVYW